MKKKLFVFLPMIMSLASCGLITDTDSSSSSGSDKEEEVTPIDPDSEGLQPADEDTGPEQILLYKTLFDPASDVRITINISNNHFSKLCQNGHPDNVTKHDIYSPCNVSFNINGEVRNYEEVGIRIKGNMSREDSASSFDGSSFNGRAHFKLSFNETFEDNPNYTASGNVNDLKARRFGHAKKINLKWNRNYDDEGFVRESYASYIMEKEGLMAQKVNNVRVTFVTETSSNTYTYQLQENIDGEFLDNRLKKVSQNGDLYKGGWVGSDCLNMTSTNNSLFGVEDCTQYKFYVYDLKTNKKNSNMSNIKNMINMLKKNDNGASQEDLKAKLDQHIDTDYLMKFMAMEWVIGNPDSLRYHYNNTYFYFSSSNGKMYPIMYDNDRCFGIDKDWISPIRYPSTTKTTMSGSMDTTQDNPLYWRTILQSAGGGPNYNYPVCTELRNKYMDYVNDYTNKYLNTSTFNTYKNKFHYKDSASGGNMSFSDYASAMTTQRDDCFASEGRSK